MEHKLTWYGHSNFKLETDNGQILVIDPFFEGNPSASSPASVIEKADAVLITHDHADHVGQAIEICKKTGATCVGVFDTINKLLTQGLPDNAIGMNIGGTVNVGATSVHMVQAMHSTDSGTATGYILTLVDGTCLYHAGDTGLFSSMELFGLFHSIDVAMLPTGGWFTMDPKQAAYACKMLKCRKAIPMHWGTFPILEQNTDSFAHELDSMAPETGLLPMQPGQTTIIRKQGDTLACECK
jgi:L-ascorbate metabolism protein UlaG (beta-lactamase superfamily)